MRGFSKKLWSFLADFSGVIGTLDLIRIWIPAILSRFRFNLFSFLVSLVIFLLVITFIFKRFKSWLASAKISYREHKIEQSIKEYEQKTINTPFADILPSNNLLQRLFEQGKAKAQGWSGDTRLASVSLFLDRFEDKADLRLQNMYVSDWKKEALIIYVGNIDILNYDEQIYDTFKNNTEKVFFLLYPNWHKAVIKAHELIADKASSNLRLHIGTHADNLLQCTFKYRVGKVDMTDQFEFNGSVLTHLKNKQATNID